MTLMMIINYEEEEGQQQVILPPRYIRQLYDVDVILWITEESETLAHHSLPCTQPIFFEEKRCSKKNLKLFVHANFLEIEIT